MAKYITLDGLSTFLGKLKDEGTTKKIFGYNIWDTPAKNIELSNSFSMSETATKTTLNLKAASSSILGGVKIGGSVSGERVDLGIDGNNKILLPVADGEPLKDRGGLSIGVAVNRLGTVLGTVGEWKGYPVLTVLNAPHADRADDAYIDRNVDSFDQITIEGVYNIDTPVSQGPWPIQNPANASGRMFVIKSNNTEKTNEVITQIFMLNNNVGGEGNVYIRSCQQGTWKPWGKLQTNIEVGAIGFGQTKTFDDFIDNGVYSGANVIQTGTSNGYPIIGYETFVLITVNGYQVGAGVTQLKHSINTNGEMKTQSRKRFGDAWTEWEDISGNNGIAEIPTASSSTLGGIKVVSTRSSSITTVGTTSASGRYYGIELDSNNKAFVNVPWTISTATTTAFGGIKLAVNPRGSSIPTSQITTGGTTAGRYYGIELDADGKAFVNVPWSASSTATASSTALTVTYKTLSSGGITISSLSKDTITRISTSTTAALTAVTGTLTISGFATKNSNKLTTYGLQFLVGTSGSPKLVVPASVKWANGIEPILTGGEIIDIVFTTTDGTNYLGTWTKYY